MTQGPAMRTRDWPGAKAKKSMGTGEERLLLLGEIAQVLLVGGADESLEERMGLHGLGFEFGVELAAEVPGVVGGLADLHVGAVRSFAGDAKAGGLELLLVFAVELVAVAVPLVDFLAFVSAEGEAVLRQPARPAPEAHGAAELVYALQLAELVNDAVLCAGVELGGVGVGEAAHVAGVLDHHHL